MLLLINSLSVSVQCATEPAHYHRVISFQHWSLTVMQDTLVAVCVDFLLNGARECQQTCVTEMCSDVTVYMEKAVWCSIVWQLGRFKGAVAVSHVCGTQCNWKQVLLCTPCTSKNCK